MKARRSALPRRPAVPSGELRAGARAAFARVRARRGVRRPGRVRPAVLARAAALGLLLGAGLVFAEATGSGLVALISDVGEGVSRAAAPAVVVERVARPAAPAESVVAAPILDPFDPFTRESRLVVSGRLPSYVLTGAERPRIDIVVNGTLVASPATDDQGRFSATVALVPGANVLSAASVRGAERVEGTPRRVVLDTVPPPLAIGQPAEGATVDGPTLRVTGQTEGGATVAVNGHAVSVGGDGAFEDLLQVQPGPLSIEVAARDPAGNETKRTVKVTVKDAAAATGALTVAVSLDRAVAQPGQTVAAEVAVADRGTLAKDVNITLSVGLSVVGSGRTDFLGRFQLKFAAPAAEGIVQVVAIASTDASSGRGAALLEVKQAP